jgi:hypothetical protein
VTFPTDISSGDAWTESFHLSGKAITGNFTIDFRAAQMTRVTVPAGSYNALVVNAVIREETTYGSLPDVPSPSPLPPRTSVDLSNETLYLVEGIGVVKATHRWPDTGLNAPSTHIELTKVSSTPS